MHFLRRYQGSIVACGSSGKYKARARNHRKQTVSFLLRFRFRNGTKWLRASLSLLDPLINEMDGQTTADASRGKTILRGYLTGPRPRPPELKPLVTISILYHHREVAVTAVTNPSWLRVRAVLIRSIVPQYFCGGVSSQMALSLRKRVTS